MQVANVQMLPFAFGCNDQGGGGASYRPAPRLGSGPEPMPNGYVDHPGGMCLEEQTHPTGS